jgi:uncharacterized protein
MPWEWEYSVVGLLVGGFVGMTGLGGGSLVAPLLILVFRMPALPAVGTGLLFAAATQLIGGLQHARFQAVDLRTVRHLAMGSLPAAVIASLLFAHLVRGRGFEDWMTTALASVLLVVSVLLLARPLLKGRGFGRWEQAPGWLLTSGGSIVGTMTAMTSVGSASLTTALLSTTTRDEGHRVVGTVLIHAMLLTFTAGMTHLFFGDVTLGLAGALLLGSIPGVIIGSRLSHLLPEAQVQRGIAMALFVLSLGILVPSDLEPVSQVQGAVREALQTENGGDVFITEATPLPDDPDPSGLEGEIR